MPPDGTRTTTVRTGLRTTLGRAATGGRAAEARACSALAPALAAVLAAVVAGALASRARTPAITPAATGYHARFAFDPNNLGTYTQGGTVRRPPYTAGQTGLLTGLSGTAEAFQVQYRKVSPTAASQVRLYFSATRATGWVTIGSPAGRAW